MGLPVRHAAALTVGASTVRQRAPRAASRGSTFFCPHHTHARIPATPATLTFPGARSCCLAALHGGCLARRRQAAVLIRVRLLQYQQRLMGVEPPCCAARQEPALCARQAPGRCYCVETCTRHRTIKSARCNNSNPVQEIAAAVFNVSAAAVVLASVLMCARCPWCSPALCSARGCISSSNT